MLIRCWGSRGSIGVSGAEYLRYGGDTTCVEVRAASGDVIVLDAGSGIRRLGNLLIAEGCTHVHLVFTHAHWDHILGFPFFKPVYRPGVTISVYGCSFAQDSVHLMLDRTMAAPNFPVKLGEVGAALEFHGACGQPFSVGSIDVTPVFLSHPNRGIGYRLEENGKSFVFMTDNELGFVHPGGLSYEQYCRAAAGADLLYHDAEMTEAEYVRTRGWGHSRYVDVVRLAIEAGVRRLGLFHHNQERTDDQVDGIVAECRQLLAARGAEIECFGVAAGTEITL